MTDESRQPGAPPDQDQRDRIVAELDSCLIVEAAAGTGKTTMMVERMLAIIRTGRCSVGELAAVTFTRKAAAEMRGRFRIKLETAAADTSGGERERLAAAAEHADRCFIGTIHSFCARLLRERPVEARVPLAFEEADEEIDEALRREAWLEYVSGLYGGDGAGAERLAAVGLVPTQLWPAFETFASYPDVEDWPQTAGRPPESAPVGEALREFVAEVEVILDALPADMGTDKLTPKMARLLQATRYGATDDPVRLMRALEEFDANTPRPVFKWWPNGKEQALQAMDRWEHFKTDVAEPALAKWRSYRYAAAMEALSEARAIYDTRRVAAGALNFADLLLIAARMLREHPEVRRYLRKRFSHLLVDEFQDTDPIQAEVMLLLAADDPTEPDWRRCRPVPGALFVVGDPKQSIYRFRRADIETYEQVKALIADTGGEVLHLTTSFRTTPDVVRRVNEASARLFPEADRTWRRHQLAPGDVPLEIGRSDHGSGLLCGVHRLVVPEEYGKRERIADWEADWIARFVRRALDEAWPVPRTESERRAGLAEAARPSDFLVLTWFKKHLGRYAAAMAAYGVPYEVSGGATASEVAELDLLYKLLRAAARPDDQVALLAVLRSELFGISDAELYAYARAAGVWSWRSNVPDLLDPETRQTIGDAFQWLARADDLVTRRGVAGGAEALAWELGLCASAASRQGGNVALGSLGCAIELLREAERRTWSREALMEQLGAMASGELDFDGVAAWPGGEAPARIMNLHKAKGLEAPVVVLADAAGRYEHPASIHVDRSGGITRGHMAVRGEKRGYGAAPTLALPGDWSELAELEERFLDAERSRLLYVAATRAGCGLFICEREGGKGSAKNPWTPLLEVWPDAPAAEDPGDAAAPAPQASSATAAPIGPNDLSRRLTSATRPTFARAAAKELSLSEAPRGPTDRPRGFLDRVGEHAVEWGKLIHLLLEQAMHDPGADLYPVAVSSCDELSLPPELANLAIETVRGVQESDIWQRARAADRVLPEAPVYVLDPTLGDPQTVVRGVIDLAFREDAGWVLVDYKTDRVAASELAGLVEHYRPQLEQYARCWNTATGDAVVETGLYLVNLDRYEPLELGPDYSTSRSHT